MVQIIKVPGINNLGVDYWVTGSGNSKTNGIKTNDKSRNSGNAILNEIKKFKDISAIDLEEIYVDNFNLTEQEQLIYSNSKKSFESKDKIIFLGGDHSISFSIGRAFLDVFGKKDSYLIVFDAHADCMPAIKEPTHEEWLSALVEKGFNPSNILLIGLRKIELEERQFLDKNKIRYWELDKIENFEIFCDSIMEFANNKNSKVYVSFDIDVVDPAFAPSTGYLEPGGLSSREILYFARRLVKLPNLNAVDIVEIDCISDAEKGNMTVKLGAKILNEFL